jgi:hypothetical protein
VLEKHWLSVKTRFHHLSTVVGHMLIDSGFSIKTLHFYTHPDMYIENFSLSVQIAFCTVNSILTCSVVGDWL